MKELIMNNANYWIALDDLVNSSEVVIDRPHGSRHPRYPDFIYPYDYGYLQGTQAMDQGGVDIWFGSLSRRSVTGIICTVDLTKRDVEIKILIGCTTEEADVILKIHNDGPQSAILIRRTGN
jgi:inorganic pyrophosphatase